MIHDKLYPSTASALNELNKINNMYDCSLYFIRQYKRNDNFIIDCFKSKDIQDYDKHIKKLIQCISIVTGFIITTSLIKNEIIRNVLKHIYLNLTTLSEGNIYKYEILNLKNKINFIKSDDQYPVKTVDYTDDEYNDIVQLINSYIY